MLSLDIPENLEQLNLMMQDSADKPSIYLPGPYWIKKSKNTYRLIKKMGLKSFRSTAIPTSFGDNPVYEPLDLSSSKILRFIKYISCFSGIDRYVFEKYRWQIRNYFEQYRVSNEKLLQLKLSAWIARLEDEFQLPNGLVGDCKEFVKINGKLYSTHYLRLLSYIDVVRKRISHFSNVESVVEIGGGFGANAHLLLTLFPNIKKFVYLDIPPNLYIASQYLKHHFDFVTDYSETRNRTRIQFDKSKEREIIAICPWQIEQLDCNIDLFWNSHSFVEMPIETIHMYIDHMKRLLTPKKGLLCLISYNNSSSGALSVADLVKSLEPKVFFNKICGGDWSWFYENHEILVGSFKD